MDDNGEREAAETMGSTASYGHEPSQVVSDVTALGVGMFLGSCPAACAASDICGDSRGPAK